MALIYEPSGKAREYSPLALNVYTGGCDHGCRYCYCKGVMRNDWGLTARPRNMAGLAKEAALADRQILLSFIGDPYCLAERTHRNTRKALRILFDAGCSVAILTKGGSRCLDDLDIFKAWPGGRIKIGATLTAVGNLVQQEWEPGACSPSERLATLQELHAAGIKTWASIEPVIDPAESLAAIDASLPYVDGYKVGRWNHDARADAIDWRAFGMAAVNRIRSAGKSLYVKVDLRPYFPAGYLTAAECDTETVTLPNRPKAKGLFK